MDDTSVGLSGMACLWLVPTIPLAAATPATSSLAAASASSRES